MIATLEKDYQQAGSEPMTRPRAIDKLDLAAVPSAVSCAQMFVAITLAHWSVDTVIEQAHEVVTQLVSHAVETTGITDSSLHWTMVDSLNLIQVRLVHTEMSVVIEVWDCDPRLPAPQTLSTLPLTYFHPRTGGKIMRCELAVHQPSGDSDNTQVFPAVLPRRVRRIQPDPSMPMIVERDPELLHRVLEGLRDLPDEGRQHGRPQE